MTESDKELLELAAKAAGHKLADEIDSYLPGSRALWIIGKGGRDAVWSPLNDDGDALRLAVKLRISIMIAETPPYAPECGYADHSGGKARWRYVSGAPSDDPRLATRRAIVRAAAEIGKAMP